MKRDTEKEEPICSTPVDSLKALYSTEGVFGNYLVDTFKPTPATVARTTYLLAYIMHIIVEQAEEVKKTP